MDRKRPPIDYSTPGPEAYKPDKPLGQDALAFKLKFKLEYGDASMMAKKRNIPAPGTYEMVSMHKEGKYVSSEMNNSKSARWSKDDRLKHFSK